MKNIERKNIISTLVIYAGFFTGLMTLSGTAKEMKLKRDAKETYLTAKIECYENLATANKEYMQAQEQNYKAELKEFKEELIKETYSKIVKIDEEYLEQITKELETKYCDYTNYGIITQDDLKYIKNISLNIKEDSDIEFLKYCTNLEQLNLYMSEKEMEKIEKLPIMSNLKTLNLGLNTKIFDAKQPKQFVLQCQI